MQFFDTVTMRGVRKTADGYLTATAKVGRSGIQVYKGREVGLTGDKADADIRVYRPESEVFKDATIHSTAHRPITLDHPPVMVDATNWKEYSRGYTGDKVLRDGEFINVPLVVMDAAAVDAVLAGRKRELSLGYSTDLKWTPGSYTKDGVTHEYDAVQTDIRMNHLAIVGSARGGEQLRIGDATDSDDSDDDDDEFDALVDAFDPDQPRDPGGPDGGQWVSGSKGEEARMKREEARKRRQAAIGYNREAVNEAIASSGRAGKKIGGKEAKLIHRLLKGRDSSDLSIIDADDLANSASTLTGDERNSEMSKTIIVDGITCEMTDTAAQVVARSIATLTDAAEKTAAELKKEREERAKEKAAADAAAVEAKKAIDTKDGEIVALKKNVADAVMTPVKLDQLVKDRQVVVDRAVALLGDKVKTDGRTEAEIRRDVVSSSLGDETAKAMSDDGITGAFNALTHDKKAPASGLQGLSRAMGGSSHSAMDAREKAYGDRSAYLKDAWRTPAPAAGAR